MNIVVVLTYEMSLEKWDKDGILDRELKLYKQLSKNFGYKFTFITFGNESDLKYLSIVPNSQIIPIYKLFKLRKQNNKIYTKFICIQEDKSRVKKS